MRKLTRLAAVIVALASLRAVAQGPPALDIFNSADGIFQFVYPETYELLVGESILKATQGRRTVLPVCDFSTALACVIYPVENERESRLEAAGFSVDIVPGVIHEAECLDFTDQLAHSRGTPSPSTSVLINSRRFRHVSTTKKLQGHTQSADFYRIFTLQKCYELQIQVSISDEPNPQKTIHPLSFEDPTAYSARESLKLILSSVVFGKE